ncbi:MAG: CrcB family protein [Actinomycetota bacterium]
MAGWREVVAVVVGGAIGTGMRLTLDIVFPHTDTGFPVSTLSVNVVGSFVLGTLITTLWRRSSTPNWVKVGLGTGVVGSFTTFSALIVSLLGEVSRGLWMLALLYLLLSLVLGFGAAMLGVSVGRWPRSTPPALDRVDE